jgi:hypothetical protein
LVYEVINGRDNMVEELMGVRRLEKWIQGRKIRERGELGGDLLFLGYFGLWEGKKIWGGRRRGEETIVLLEQFCLRTLTGAQLLLGIFGSGARKP